MIPEISLDRLWRREDFDRVPEERIDGSTLALLASFEPRQIARKIGWLERTFNLPMQDECINYMLHIDGVPRDTQLWLNGRDFGEIEAPFSADVTDLVALEDNLIAFRVLRGARGKFGAVRLVAIPCD
jgi:hypothetical protein